MLDQLDVTKGSGDSNVLDALAAYKREKEGAATQGGVMMTAV